MSEETRGRQAMPFARWWMPVPYTLGRGDEDVRVISRSAFGVYVQLLLSAHARGTIDHVPFVNHHDGLGTIGVVALREGDLPGGESVREDVDDLIDAGYVTIDETERAIRLLRGLEACRATVDPSPMQPQPMDAPRDPTLAIKTAEKVEPTRKRRARSTSLTPSHAATLRNARWYFEHRTTRPRGPWKDVPAGTSFDAWLSTPDGEKWSAAKGISAASTATVGAEPRVSDVAVATPATDTCDALLTTVATPATPSVADAGNALQDVGNALQRPPSLTLSPSENTSEKDQNTPCNARVEESVASVASVATHDADGNGNALRKSATPHVATRTVTVASAAPITAKEISDLARERLGDRIIGLGVGEMMDFDLCIELVSVRWSDEHHEAVTRAHWLAFVAWLEKGGTDQRGGLSWWSRGVPKLSWFLRNANLYDKFTEAMLWWPERRRQSAPKSTTASAPNAIAAPKVSEAERANMRASAASALEKLRARAGRSTEPTKRPTESR